MAELLIQNQNLVYDGVPGWTGYNITRTTDTDLIFRNNYLSSDNISGYMLIAGDEVVGPYNNNLDGAIIEHNYFDWNGAPLTSIITHGVFGGYNIGFSVKYNYLDRVPMGIIRKSNGMTDTGGIVAYNIIKDPKPGVVCKGMNGVQIHNNTFYSSLNTTTENQYNRAFVECYYNDSIGISATSKNCKVYNNIFYAVNSGIRFIWVDQFSIEGFECDYNIYWCENSVNNEPIFNYNGSNYSWAQWRALGFDAHSVILNPHFHTTTDFIPERRLNYGINLGLGSLVSHGIDYENTWSTATTDGIPKTQIQDSNWQVGAVTLRTGNDIGGDYYLAPWGSDTLGDGSFNNPKFTLSSIWSSLVPGDTVYLRGGTYVNTARQNLTGINGTADNMINIYAYQNEIPIFTDDGVATYGSWPQSYIYFAGDYFHWKGIEWSYIEQRPGPTGGGWCLWANNSDNNIFEKLHFHHCNATLSIYGTSTGNLILNSDSHHNQDPYSVDQYGGSDGFSIHYCDYGTINTIKGCRMWWNSDDGLDCWHTNGTVIVEDCWSWYNGFIPGTFTAAGNGEGFKLGDTTANYSSEVLRYVSNSVAYYNRRCGFSPNGANCRFHMYNNTAYDNQGQTYGAGFFFNFYDTANVFKNNVSFDNSTDWVGYYLNSTYENNSYNALRQPLGPVINSGDFLSVDCTLFDSPRQYDGSLPILNTLHPILGSDVIGAGQSLTGYDTDCDGKDWLTIPSIGAFEYQEALSGYYVAPFGSDSTGTGTFANPYATLYKAWTTHTAAGTQIYMRGGVYELDAYLNLDTYSGTSGNLRKVFNYPNEQPTFKPSTTWLDSTSYTGLYLRADWVHVKGLEIAEFVQRKYCSYYDGSGWEGTTSFQLYDSDNCILELLNCHHGGFGIGLSGDTKGTGNLLLNCDAHHNYDPFTIGYEYGGIDGITVRIDLTAGTTNTIRGCRMWDNSDDGFDGWGNEGMLEWDSCWAWHNGYREDGITAGGDGNGIKFGPIRTLWESDQHEYNQHLRTLQNCIAAFNRSWGFHENATCCIRWIYNNIAYNNLNGGFAFNNNYIINPIDIVRNNISYGTNNYFFFNSSSTVDHNTKNYNNTTNTNYSVSNIDFLSLDSSLLDTARQADGSLPILDFLHLAEGSDLINTGIDVGIELDGDGSPWHSTTPSLGAFEYPYYIVRPTVTTTTVTAITTTTASSGGNVTDDGGATVTSRGVCWNTTGTPTTANSTTSNGTGTGSYTSSLTGLTPDTIYYVRAYATNLEGTSYGNEVSFETNELIVPPTVTTDVVKDIQAVTATSGGNVLSNGNATVTARGVCWNTTGNPTVASSCTIDGTGTGTFISYLTNLIHTTHYYVRAYATNSVGTGYGSVVEFDTLEVKDPVLLTDNLVAFYKMNDNNTPPVDIINAYDFDTTVDFPDYLMQGKKGYAIEYSATPYTCHVASSYRSSLLPPADVFSLSFWIKFVALPIGENINQQIFFWQHSGVTPYFLSIYYRGSNDKFNFYFKTNDGGYCETQATSAVAVNTWYHVVCVANGIGQRANMYVNTTQYISYTNQIDIVLQADSNLYVGNTNTVVSVIQANAMLDEIGIWHRALTEEEVIELYNDGNGLTYPFDGTEDEMDLYRYPLLSKYQIL